MATVTETDPTGKLTCTEALQAAYTLAVERLPVDSHGRLEKALALVEAGQVFETDHGHWEVASQSESGVLHSVNGSCDCDWLHFHPGNRCTHMLAVLLARKTLLLMQPPHADGALQSEPEPTPPAPEPAREPVQGIDPRWLVDIHGQAFIRFEGLLALSHEKGLVELSTTVVLVTAELAVCQAVARFKDGLVVTDIGDASPANVKPHLKPHFIRVSATRASARALRRALNIAAVAEEELD